MPHLCHHWLVYATFLLILRFFFLFLAMTNVSVYNLSAPNIPFIVLLMIPAHFFLARQHDFKLSPQKVLERQCERKENFLLLPDRHPQQAAISAWFISMDSTSTSQTIFLVYHLLWVSPISFMPAFSHRNYPPTQHTNGSQQILNKVVSHEWLCLALQRVDSSHLHRMKSLSGYFPLQRNAFLEIPMSFMT